MTGDVYLMFDEPRMKNEVKELRRELKTKLSQKDIDAKLEAIDSILKEIKHKKEMINT